MKIIHRDPALHAQRVAAIKLSKSTPAARKRASETLKSFFSDAENRRRRSISMTGVKFFCRNCGREGHRSHYCPDHGETIDRRFRCGMCGERGHNRRTCNKPRMRNPKQRVLQQYHCRACGQVGHNRRTCPLQTELQSGDVLTRYRSSYEDFTTYVRKKYRCSVCGQCGHNSRTCPQQPIGEIDLITRRRSRRPYHCRTCGALGHNQRTCVERIAAMVKSGIHLGSEDKDKHSRH